MSRETVAQAQESAGSADSARASLGAVLKAWLRAVIALGPRRIILETGPAVLGLCRARLLQEASTQAPIRRSIERAIANRETQQADSDLLARLLSAAVSELALIALQRRLNHAQLGRLDPQIDALIDALLPPAL